MPTLYPMLQQPVLKPTIWGGQKLRDLFGKPVVGDQKIGESWEVADHPHGTSRVGTGPLKGRSLRQIVEGHTAELFGEPVMSAWCERFPLLVKIIDASDDLSIQVHPDDAYMAQHRIDDYGKTECWVILQADPGARLITGVQPGTDRDEFRKAAAAGQLEGMLIEQQVRPGDFLFIPAGRLHAIGAGIVLAEFQQPSDTTYRVYDWGRVDKAGKSRELHLDQAVECICFDGHFPEAGGLGVVTDAGGVFLESLVEGDKFTLHRARVTQAALPRTLDRGFECAMIISGKGFLSPGGGGEPLPVRAGQTVLVPASTAKYVIRSEEGLTALLSGVTQR